MTYNTTQIYKENERGKNIQNSFYELGIPWYQNVENDVRKQR